MEILPNEYPEDYVKDVMFVVLNSIRNAYLDVENNNYAVTEDYMKKSKEINETKNFEIFSMYNFPLFNDLENMEIDEDDDIEYDDEIDTNNIDDDEIGQFNLTD